MPKPLLSNFFKTDPLSGKPLKNIPGDPAGDAVTYIAALEPSLNIVAYPKTFSGKGLEFSSKPINDPSSGHIKWLSFIGAPTSNFSASLAYFLVCKFNNFSEQLLVDITSDLGGVFNRLVVAPDGTVTALESFDFGAKPVIICRLKPDVDYLLTLIVNMKMNTTRITFFGSVIVDGEEDASATKIVKPMFDPLGDVQGPFKPSINFQWEHAATGASKFTFTGVEIKQ